ncbi:MAG: hypothetical protein AAF191_04930, partial [Verrucomicrobiota bacterium]
ERSNGAASWSAGPSAVASPDAPLPPLLSGVCLRESGPNRTELDGLTRHFEGRTLLDGGSEDGKHWRLLGGARTSYVRLQPGHLVDLFKLADVQFENPVSLQAHAENETAWLTFNDQWGVRLPLRPWPGSVSPELKSGTSVDETVRDRFDKLAAAEGLYSPDFRLLTPETKEDWPVSLILRGNVSPEGPAQRVLVWLMPHRFSSALIRGLHEAISSTHPAPSTPFASVADARLGMGRLSEDSLQGAEHWQRLWQDAW